MVPGKELIQACIEDNRAAHNRLYRLCYSPMMQITMRYARDKDDATELLNLSFFKLISQLAKYNTDLPFEPWMRQLTVNVILDKFRAEKRYKEYYVPIDPQESILDIYRDESETDQKIDYDYLIQLIRELPPMTASVFNLYAVDGFKHKEIAQMLGMSENTSKWHLSNARQLLQNKLLKQKEVRSAT
jgi:RNA polymerase sigma-70 factor (ECF subfamily)